MIGAIYFVTGASGFVGRHLCQRLRERGHRVRGLVRGHNPTLEAMGVEIVHGDLSNCAAWKDQLARSDYLIHAAANASFGSGSSYATTNVEGTRSLLTIARSLEKPLRRFVFVSSVAAVDRTPGDSCRQPLDENSPLAPSSDYGRSKRDAEQLVRESGLPFSIVRPALVVGGDMRIDSHASVFARTALRGGALARFAWPGGFGVVHADDLADAIELCAAHPDAEGRIFFCAGSPVPLRDCFDLANPDASRLPMNWLAAVARTIPGIFPFKLKAVLLPALTASNVPLERLGWQPRFTATQALQEVTDRERARQNPNLDPGGQTVITGAASGLGRALVERIAPRRKNLLLIDRDRAGLERVKEKFPHCRLTVVDLADEAAVAQLVASENWRAFPITELFACAGMGIRGRMMATDAERHARLFKVNLLTRLTLAHAVLPEMTRRYFGRIVFVSSSSAFQPLPSMASYAASNAALLHLGEAWSAELAGTGVQLLTVCPGGMQTNFQNAAGVKTLPNERLMPPEQVADEIVEALAKQKRIAIISTRAHAMAWLARLLPRGVSVALWKKLMERLR
jgi:nucleoside-diphosphate-sugar epimerase